MRTKRFAITRRYKKSKLVSRAIAMLALVAVMMGTAPAADAATITVDSTGGDVTADGKCTLREAINKANSDAKGGDCADGSGADTIVLAAAAIYTLTVVDNSTNGPSGLPTITSEITIDGNGSTIARSSAVGTPDFRIFDVSSGGNLTLNDVSVTNGAATSNGGGILIQNGLLNLNGSEVVANHSESSGGGIAAVGRGLTTVVNSTLSGNSAASTGGAIFSQVSLTIDNSTLSGNSAASNGGAIDSTNDLTIDNSTLSENSTGSWGGGIYNTSNLTISSSILNGNSSSGLGGGIFSDFNLTVNGSTLSGNSSQAGGGISGRNVAVNNSTLSGNSAATRGGGIESFGDLTINNATVTANTGTEGGGVFTPFGTTSLKNAVIAGNSGGSTPDCSLSGTVVSLGHNLIGNTGTISPCNINPVAGDQIGTPAAPIDPLLGPLQSNGGPTETHALLTGSPAIDKGTPQVDGGCTDPNGNPFTTDQRGFARPVNGGTGAVRCDIGSFELDVVLGTIEIRKATDPAGAAGFTFVADDMVPNTFSLADGESQIFEVAPGAHLVTENDSVAASGGYVLSGLACSDSDAQGIDSTTDLATRTANINLEPLESIVCTFTNTLPGSITITKSTLPADGADFNFTGDLGGFTLDDAIPADGDGFGHAITFGNLLVGQYEVSELVPAGWTLDHVTCTTQDTSDTTTATPSGVVIDLDPTEGIICSFVNRGSTVEPPTEPPTGSQGCTPGYWKNHLGSWAAAGLSTGQSVESVFDQATAYPAFGSANLLDGLSFKGGRSVEGAVGTLLRTALASVLDASHPDVNYPRTAATVIVDVNTALASGDRDTMLALSDALDLDNNLGCSLN